MTAKFRKRFFDAAQQREDGLKTAFKRAGVDMLVALDRGRHGALPLCGLQSNAQRSRRRIA